MDQLKNGVDSKGVEAEKTEKPQALTVAAVDKMLKSDLHVCLLMLQAIHDDPDVRNLLAIALHGKYMNHLHKKELDAQVALDIVKANR